MVNPYQGEVALVVNGQRHVLRLTLGALVRLETKLNISGLLGLVERFESGAFASRDILALLEAGLLGGGGDPALVDLSGGQIEGGPVGAAKVAAQLLARSFSVDKKPE